MDMILTYRIYEIGIFTEYPIIIHQAENESETSLPNHGWGKKTLRICYN